MNHWFRMYNEVHNDPKVQTLPPVLFKGWVNLLCLTSINGGILPPIGDVAFRLHLSKQKASNLVDTLVRKQLFEKHEDGRIEPHNWNSRQFKSDDSTPRVKRFRETKRNGEAAVTHQRIQPAVSTGRVEVTAAISHPEQNRAEQNRADQNRTEKPSVPQRISKTEQDSLPEPDPDERTNGIEIQEKDYQQYWGPVEGYLRKQVVAESFQLYYAGTQVLGMTSKNIFLAVPSALINAHKGSETTATLLEHIIKKSETGFLRGRSLRVVPLETVKANGAAG